MKLDFGQARRLIVGSLGAALMVSLIATSSASAVLKRLPNGQVVSYQPLRGAPPGWRRH